MCKTWRFPTFLPFCSSLNLSSWKILSKSSTSFKVDAISHLSYKPFIMMKKFILSSVLLSLIQISAAFADGPVNTIVHQLAYTVTCRGTPDEGIPNSNSTEYADLFGALQAMDSIARVDHPHQNPVTSGLFYANGYFETNQGGSTVFVVTQINIIPKSQN
jgi:hypothetical protein